MTNRADLMGVSQVRRVVGQVIHDEPLMDHVVQAAREMANGMCQEAAEYGFTKADVVRSILKKPRCGCATCQARRTEASKRNEVAAFSGDLENSGIQ